MAIDTPVLFDMADLEQTDSDSSRAPILPALDADLKRFDRPMSRAQLAEVAEVALAVQEQLGSDSIESIHPSANHKTRCSELPDDLFFPSEFEIGQWTAFATDEKGKVIEGPNGPYWDGRDTYYITRDGQDEIVLGNPMKDPKIAAEVIQARRETLMAKKACNECSGRDQCLIWALLSEVNVQDEQVKSRVPLADRLEPTNGVFGGWAAPTRRTIRDRISTLRNRGVVPSEANQEQARRLIQTALAGGTDFTLSRLVA